MELGETIHTGWVGRFILATRGIAGIPTEYVVGRDVYECAVVGFDGFGKVAHGSGIEQLGKLGVVLGLVDVGVGGAVDDYIYVVVLDHAGHGFGIGYVKLGHIGEDVVVAGVFRGVADAVAELSVGPGYENVHSA